MSFFNPSSLPIRSKVSDATLSSSMPLVTAPSPNPQYLLLELPKELLAIIQQHQQKALQEEKEIDDEDGNGKRKRKDDKDDLCLTINGRFKDDAILSTTDKTYSIRQVSQSNSLLLCSTTKAKIDNLDSSTGDQDDEEESALQLNTTLTSTLELLLVPPKLERISNLLKWSLYQGQEEEERRLRDQKKEEEDLERLPKRRRIEIKENPRHRLYTPREVRSVVQASQSELKAGLRERNVVELDGHLRLISPTHLFNVLKLVLNHVSIHSYLPSSVPLHSTIKALEKEHDSREEILREVLTCWFGKINSETRDGNEDEVKVELNDEEIVKFLGNRVLEAKKEPSPLKEMIDEWKESVGDVFEDKVNLDLLKGQYLLKPSLPDQSSSTLTKIQSFPKAHLPLEPAARFQELFLTKPQWVKEDLEPFIKDLATDSKKLDALLLKFARVSRVKIQVETHEKVQQGKAKGKKRAEKEMKEITVYSARIKY